MANLNIRKGNAKELLADIRNKKIYVCIGSGMKAFEAGRENADHDGGYEYYKFEDYEQSEEYKN